MVNLYEHIEQLGIKHGFKTITALCREAGVPRATMTELKMGRSKDLSKPNALKFAEALGVSLDEIYGKKEKPADQMADGLGDKKERLVPTDGNKPVSVEVMSENTMIRTQNPFSMLTAQYCIPSDVMDIIAGAKSGSCEAWKNSLGVPTKEQYQKIAEFFELDIENLEHGIIPLFQSKKVWGKLAKETEERFHNSLPALKSVQKYYADSSEENYQELINCLKDLSPDARKKIIREIMNF